MEGKEKKMQLLDKHELFPSTCIMCNKIRGMGPCYGAMNRSWEIGRWGNCRDKFRTTLYRTLTKLGELSFWI